MVILRTPKGTLDYNQKSSLILETIINNSVAIFKKHGASPIRTPIFELKDILLNKYGDDSKLIFDLKEQGGDICSLRYDLTVPFARYLAQNNIQKIKRYQYGEVFRRDQPAITKGRFREFIQCDFDIAGSYCEMLADAEVVKIACECLETFNIGKFSIKVNHRQILSSILTLANIDISLHNTVCSTIDKMDKLRLEDITAELKSKGCDDEGIKTIESYISIKGPISKVEELKNDRIYQIPAGKKGIDDLLLLHEYLSYFNASESLIYDLSLARGSDYYTGLIFEGSFYSHAIGSVVGGGRYDNLVDNFVKENGGKGMTVPCVGFSVGVMRIYTILLEKQANNINEVFAYVGSSGGSFLRERLLVTNILWENKISAETYFSEKLHFNKQATHCQKNGIKILLILGEKEIKEEGVEILDNLTKKRTFVKYNQLVEFLKAHYEIN